MGDFSWKLRILYKRTIYSHTILYLKKGVTLLKSHKDVYGNSNLLDICIYNKRHPQRKFIDYW